MLKNDQNVPIAYSFAYAYIDNDYGYIEWTKWPPVVMLAPHLDTEMVLLRWLVGKPCCRRCWWLKWSQNQTLWSLSLKLSYSSHNQRKSPAIYYLVTTCFNPIEIHPLSAPLRGFLQEANPIAGRLQGSTEGGLELLVAPHGLEGKTYRKPSMVPIWGFGAFL